MKGKLYLSWMSLLIVTILCFGFVSCGDDEEESNGGSNDLVGYWVKEAHLNSPARNGSSGTVISYGFQFLGNGTVYMFQMQHTGLSSRYSYAEANTSWDKVAERNGVSFYINPDKKTKSYTRVNDEVYIDASTNPIIMTIVGTDRIKSVSSDGWADGNYVRVKK